MDPAIRFVRFRPPSSTHGRGSRCRCRHIRLDRALQFLIGDHLA
ncbi:YcjX family protein [Mesorhizobium newzealandense]|uniref:YcjX family protein n=1 Tax=Mesorhizobium newzealandense TaxID=1300302 RepID=A0ABW4U700_9HYPH